MDGQQADGEQAEAQAKDLLELLQMLETHTPVIPDTLMDYYMTKAGVQCDDPRLYLLQAVMCVCV